MAEDPIIVKPGVYPDPDPKNPARSGIYLVFDDDSWVITEDESGIAIKIPPGSRWKAVADYTTPSPEDPSVSENPLVKGKKKVALFRMNGVLADIDSHDATISFTVT
jgi:hypothetical protein